jgi:hypothetical protein
MDLKVFINLASEKERDQLCSKCDTTILYLRKLGSGGKCSVAMAYKIELATAEIAVRNRKLLRRVDGASLVSKPENYSAFKKMVGVAA